MIEFAFCLPLLGFLLALIFFFGWSMNNQQQVKMAARHSVWRSVRGPAVTTGAEINGAFFGDKSDRVGIDNHAGWQETMPGNYMSIMQFPEQTSRQLAQNMVIGTFPFGRMATVEAHFPTSVKLWQQFQGDITSSVARDGVEWRRGQVDWTIPVRDQFLVGLDGTLSNIQSPGNGLGLMMRQLYMAHW